MKKTLVRSMVTACDGECLVDLPFHKPRYQHIDSVSLMQPQLVPHKLVS